MLSRKKTLIVAMVGLSMIGNSCPIGQTTVNVISGVGGVATGGLVGAITYNGLNDWAGADHSKKTTQKFLSVLAGGGSGALATYILYKWLCNYTPEGRYYNSLKFYEKLKNDSMLSNEQMSEADLISHVNSRWVGNWPLVLAREFLTRARSELTESLNRIDKAMNELKGGEDPYGLYNKSVTLKKLLLEFAPIIEHRVGMITNNPSYNFQVNIYQKHLEKEKDREENAWHHTADRWDRQREREQKQSMFNRLEASGRPVNVNLNL